ncbi:MAG: hypothetical protein OXF90_07715, partial [Chloroflexi bacterium]|nr:hypothetical protein [Chloroflexota bacterium]
MNGFGWTSIFTISAENAAQHVDFVGLGKALAGAVSFFVGIFRGFDPDGVGDAGGGERRADGRVL